MLELVAAFLVKTTVILGMANGVCSIRGLSAAERHAAASIGVLGVAMVGVLACLPAWNIAVPAVLVPFDWASTGLARSPSEVPGEPVVFAASPASDREIPVWGWLLTVYIGIVSVLGTGSICRYLRVARRIRRLPPWRGCGPDGVGVLVDTSGTPWTWGLRRPVIVLPEGFDGWTSKRQQAAIAHEMGHIRRRDWVIDLVAEWLCNIFWFQPLIWVTWRRQRGYAERPATMWPWPPVATLATTPRPCLRWRGRTLRQGWRVDCRWAWQVAAARCRVGSRRFSNSTPGAVR